MKIEDAVQINCSEIAVYFNGVYFFLEDDSYPGTAFYFLSDLLKLSANKIEKVAENLRPCIEYEGGGGFHWDEFWNTVNLIYRIKKNPKNYENIIKTFKLNSDKPNLESIFWKIDQWYIDFDDEDYLDVIDYDYTPYKIICKKAINYYPGLILEMLGENKNASKNNSRRTGNKKKLYNNKTKQKRDKTIRTKNSKRMAIT
jgi:hypothetical protein